MTVKRLKVMSAQRHRTKKFGESGGFGRYRVTIPDDLGGWEVKNWDFL